MLFLHEHFSTFVQILQILNTKTCFCEVAKTREQYNIQVLIKFGVYLNHKLLMLRL